MKIGNIDILSESRDEQAIDRRYKHFIRELERVTDGEIEYDENQGKLNNSLVNVSFRKSEEESNVYLIVDVVYDKTNSDEVNELAGIIFVIDNYNSKQISDETLDDGDISLRYKVLLGYKFLSKLR